MLKNQTISTDSFKQHFSLCGPITRICGILLHNLFPEMILPHLLPLSQFFPDVLLSHLNILVG